MLKGIHPLLTPELLHALRSAGHGDVIAVVDCNFPAASVAKTTHRGAPIVLAGSNANDAIDAILSLLPLDYFLAFPVRHMCPDPSAGPIPEIGQAAIDECSAIIVRHNATFYEHSKPLPLPRAEFYEAAKRAFCIVQASGERRPYVNFLLSKGVIGIDGNDLIPPKN